LVAAPMKVINLCGKTEDAAMILRFSAVTGAVVVQNCRAPGLNGGYFDNNHLLRKDHVVFSKFPFMPISVSHADFLTNRMCIRLHGDASNQEEGATSASNFATTHYAKIPSFEYSERGNLYQINLFSSHYFKVTFLFAEPPRLLRTVIFCGLVGHENSPR